MNKLNSRKLWAWIVSSLFMVAFIFFVKEAVIPYLPYYGAITGIYIGFQAVVDFIPALIKLIKAWKSKGKEDEEC